MANNLMQELLAHDRAEATKMERKTITSKKLQKLFGAKDPVEIEIRELTPREINEINEFSEGNNEFEGTFYACSKAIMNPNLRDKELQDHYGAKNAMELCELLFGMECAQIASEAMELSGIDMNEAVDLIKN